MRRNNGCLCVCVSPCSNGFSFACANSRMQGVQAAHCHPVLHQRRHWMCAGEIDPGRWINVPARDTTPLFPRFLLFPWWFSCYFPKPPPAAVPLSRRRVLQSRTNFCSTDSTERTTSPYRSIAFSSWIMNLNEPVTKCVCVCHTKVHQNMRNL